MVNSSKGSVKLKGDQFDTVDIFWRTLRKKEAAGNITAVTIDEFMTSLMQ